MRVGFKVRSTLDGQRGIVVEDDLGNLVVRLDRPAERRQVPYSADFWAPAADERLTPMQLARVAYEADQALRTVRGEYGIPNWLGVREQQRLPWMHGPPAGADEQRMKLYRAITAAIAE